MGRFINTDVFASTGQGLLGNNMFAYCNNNPVNLTDPSGCIPQWVDKIWTTVRDFFSSDTGTVSTSWGSGNTIGFASITAGYSEFALGGMGQNQAIDRKRDLYQTTGFVGLNGSASMVHASAGGAVRKSLGMGMTGDVSIDILSLTGYAGYQYKNGLGAGAGIYASALSGSTTATFEIYGWQLILGINGDLGAIGFEAQAGFTNGVAECKVKGALGVGIGFVIQIGLPEHYY